MGIHSSNNHDKYSYSDEIILIIKVIPSLSGLLGVFPVSNPLPRRAPYYLVSFFRVMSDPVAIDRFHRIQLLK